MSNESRLESMLSSLRESVDWPVPSPDLPARVVANIASVAARPNRRLRPRVVVFVALLTVALVFTLSPSAREAVADLFGEAGIRIGLTDDVSLPDGAELGLGEPIAADGLREAATFAVRLPVGAAPGTPDGVYLDEVGRVSMVWVDSSALPAAGDTGVGLLLTQFEATGALDVGEKAVGSASDVVELTVEGQPALWIEGAEHILTWLDEEERPVVDTSRLAANVLLWESRGVYHRLETTGDLESALAIVASLEPLP